MGVRRERGETAVWVLITQGRRFTSCLRYHAKVSGPFRQEGASLVCTLCVIVSATGRGPSLPALHLRRMGTRSTVTECAGNE